MTGNDFTIVFLSGLLCVMGLFVTFIERYFRRQRRILQVEIRALKAKNEAMNRRETERRLGQDERWIADGILSDQDRRGADRRQTVYDDPAR